MELSKHTHRDFLTSRFFIRFGKALAGLFLVLALIMTGLVARMTVFAPDESAGAERKAKPAARREAGSLYFNSTPLLSDTPSPAEK